MQSDFPSIIREIRGAGLLVGIKITPDLNLFIKKLLDNKLLTIRAAENVVRLLPPLNVKKENIDQAIVILRKVCKTFK
jgi:acetylornithine/N-succinyldiaminopimelate aminotransferase